MNEAQAKDIYPILVFSFKESELLGEGEGHTGTLAEKGKVNERGRQLFHKKSKYSCPSPTTRTPNLFINSLTWQIFLEHLPCARHYRNSKKNNTPSLSLKKKCRHINNFDKVSYSYHSLSTSSMPGTMLIPLHVLSCSTP